MCISVISGVSYFIMSKIQFLRYDTNFYAFALIRVSIHQQHRSYQMTPYANHTLEQIKEFAFKVNHLSGTRYPKKQIWKHIFI